MIIIGIIIIITTIHPKHGILDGDFPEWKCK